MGGTAGPKGGPGAGIAARDVPGWVDTIPSNSPVKPKTSAKWALKLRANGGSVSGSLPVKLLVISNTRNFFHEIFISNSVQLTGIFCHNSCTRRLNGPGKRPSLLPVKGEEDA